MCRTNERTDGRASERTANSSTKERAAVALSPLAAVRFPLSFLLARSDDDGTRHGDACFASQMMRVLCAVGRFGVQLLLLSYLHRCFLFVAVFSRIRVSRIRSVEVGPINARVFVSETCKLQSDTEWSAKTLIARRLLDSCTNLEKLSAR